MTVHHSDWRALTNATPWADHDVVIVGQSGGKGSTRPRVQTYEVYLDGRLVAARPRLTDAQDFVSERRGEMTWVQHREEPMEVVHYHYGPTSEFGSPSVYWVGVDAFR